MPGYYGMTPWGLYPTGGLIGAAGQMGATRRPLSPSPNELNPQGGQYQVIPAYYDQNGGLVMGRGGTPLRLLSPSSILVNSPGTTMKLISSHLLHLLPSLLLAYKPPKLSSYQMVYFVSGAGGFGVNPQYGAAQAYNPASQNASSIVAGH